MSRKRRKQTIKSIADQFQSIPNSTSWTFSALTNTQDLSTKAACDFQSVPNSTSWTFSALKTSGYQVVLGLTGDQNISASDSLNLAETVSIQVPLSTSDSLPIADSPDVAIKLTADDGLGMADSASIATPGGPVFDGTDDPLSLTDSSAVSASYATADSLNLSETISQTIILNTSDSIPITDSSASGININTSDSLNLNDDAVAGVSISANDALNLTSTFQIRKGWKVKYSTAVLTRHAHKNKYGTEVQVRQYTAPAVNNLTDPANGAEPTLVLNGDYIVQNTSSDKGSAGQYISLKESAIDPNCQLKSWNFDYQIGGGTFSIASIQPVGNIGDDIAFFGIPCVITAVEDESSDSGEFSITSGIVGNSTVLDQEILLTLDTSNMINMRPLFPNTPVQAPSSVQWTTISEAARAICAYAGISLRWDTKDAPLVDAFLETGMTIKDALQSLASRVNAFSTFDGVDSWIVFDPDIGFGGWAPNLGSGCGVWTKEGLKVKRSLNLKTKSVQIPVKPSTSGAVTYIANPLTANPPIIETIKTFKAPVDNDTMIPIPADNHSDLEGTENGSAFNTFRQILMPTQDSQVIGNTYIPGTIVKDGVQRVAGDTLDPNEWTPHTLPVVKDDKGVSYWVVRNSDFDENLSSPDFEYKIGYRRNTKPLTDAFQQQQSEQEQRNRLYDQYQQERIRYFPVNTGTANMVFFGSIPIPGNNISLTKATRSISGIVESVSAQGTENSVPQITIGITKYLKINQLLPKAYLDWFLATGGISP
jgi:hypothetical protein